MKKKIFLAWLPFILSPLIACFLLTISPLFGTQTRNNPPTPGVIGNWHLNENSGTVAFDSSHIASVNAGTVSGAIWSVGKYGSCLKFSGASNDNVAISDNNPLLRPAVVTFSLWFKASAPSMTGALISRKSASGATWMLEFNVALGDGTGRIFFSTNEGSWDAPNGFTRIRDMNWHYVCAEITGAYKKLWLDGRLEINSPFSTTLIYDANNLYIGSYNGSGSAFGGSIDEVTIYNRVATEAEKFQDFMDGVMLRDERPVRRIVEFYAGRQCIGLSSAL